MLFVKTEELKRGMRLARPIYNREGVLLYERDSKLTGQSIESIRNFGMIGIFILEPAEPVPPMSREDLEFERFQAMTVYMIREETDRIIQTGKALKLQTIAANIITSYGRFRRRINFVQNLRSKEDYIYKHCLNAAILCAMISHVMKISPTEQLDAVLSALVHDIGELMATNMDMDFDKERKEQLLFNRSMDVVENLFTTNPSIKRACLQARNAYIGFNKGVACKTKMTAAARILLVSDMYDTMTAMKVNEELASEVAALRTLLQNPDFFDQEAVRAFIASINLLVPGTCVELNTGEKGLIINTNPNDILRPVIICFTDNTMIDLSDKHMNDDLEIVDIMKTMDNRYVMKEDLL